MLIIVTSGYRIKQVNVMVLTFDCSVTMADPAVVLAKKAKLEEVKIKDGAIGYDIDGYFEEFRPDKVSRCTWTKDSCPKDSPHIHNENV